MSVKRYGRFGSTSMIDEIDPEEAIEPPVSIAHGFEGSCEACSVPVQVGDRVHVYGDDVVVHERCPSSRERARA